jgi:hypothetical protein
MTALLAALTVAASFTVIGPGALAPATPGVLERAQERRLHGCCERNLERPAPSGWALAAVESCDLVGYDGLLVVPGVGVYPSRVVDCQRRDEVPRLSEVGLLADVNRAELGHRRAYLIVRRSYHGATLSD